MHDCQIVLTARVQVAVIRGRGLDREKYWAMGREDSQQKSIKGEQREDSREMKWGLERWEF